MALIFYEGGVWSGKENVSKKAPNGSSNRDKLEKMVLRWSLALETGQLLLAVPFQMPLRNFHELEERDCCRYISFM